MSAPPRPLVLTLSLDAATQRRLDAERARWFPAGRTEVAAHVTLFHALPGECEQVTPDRARATLAALERGFAPFDADALGFDLWRYDGGPWTPLTHVPFVP